MAFSSAEAGLAHGLGLLTELPSWDGAPANITLPGQGQFTVTGSRQTVNRQSGSLRLVTLSSDGTSPDGIATVTLTQQAIQYSVLANPPDVPLIVAGGLDVSGNFEVAANPNGGGDGVPLSIWTDLDVDMNNGSGTTCGLQEFSDGACSSSPYSEKGYQGPDILDNDANFPTDLMEYLFNVPADDWPTLKADADLRLTSCAGLGPASVGLIWVDGDCSLNANVTVGSIQDPVILVVTDGDLIMNGGAEINGMVFSFKKPTTVGNFELDMVGSARVNGVVASNHPVGHANGTYNSVYDADVLESLEQNDAFQRVAIVPGSWRDF
ncbi:hypothetical protein OCL06_14125 [Alteromonas sp. ASW11-19]|uniref:Uncharacterized protein n=2 Tax=Alteromonas salexigens TaxID=2982530 RepID=A0ABT2VQY4_9ALTE|nr:hypothetical protein [Alteromonas salexigens]